jgi:hypothetical protein
MGRPRKSESKAVDASETLDKLIAGVDPVVLMAGLLGATAAVGGVTPPFTRLLTAINQDVSTDDITKLLAVTGPGYIYYTSKSIASWLGIGGEATSEDKTAAVSRYALAASGAFEAMLMMTLVRNPATISAIGSAIGGVTGSVAAGAKLLGV